MKNSFNEFFLTNKFPRMCGRLISQVRYTVGANVRNFSGLTSDSRFANCNRLALRQLRAPWRRMRETWLHRGKMIASNSGRSDGRMYPQMRKVETGGAANERALLWLHV